MSNKLFIVCPFSCMENFIRQKYGDDVLFITAKAAVLQSEKQEFPEEVKLLIERESITQIFIVNDTSCRFINSVLKKENELDAPVEKTLRKIFTNNYPAIIQKPSLSEQQEMLAVFNVKHQANEMLKSMLFQQNHSKKIKLIGLVSIKASNRIREISMNI